MTKCSLILVLVVICALFGCQKTDTGNTTGNPPNSKTSPSPVEQDDIDIVGSYRSLTLVNLALQQLPDRSIKFRFSLAATSKTAGAELCGTARLEGDSATFKNDNCEMRLKFEYGKLVVTSIGKECKLNENTSLDGDYAKISNLIPELSPCAHQ